MKNTVTPFLLALVFWLCSVALPTAQAQDCDAYFPFKVGAILEMTGYDAKGKTEGKSKMEIIEKTTIDNGVVAKAKTTIYDNKGKEVTNNKFDVKCADGVFYMDFKNFMPAESEQMFKNMEATVDANYLEFPANLQVGQTLPDGVMTMNMNSNGMALFTMNININNRKVEAKENITTPAGTFECFKISQETTVRTIMTITTKSITWYAKDVGAVRTESYDRKGKLTGYTELTMFKE
ncbi:MAG TPA: hypothetical protein PK239_13430 [Chitinophagales bacterium]|nr:hypothetical protein [Chitinophagales bacterium]